MKWHHFLTKFVANQRLKLILNELKKADKQKIRILDVGCGNRYITNSIKNEGYNIIGIDLLDTASWMNGQKPDFIMDASKMTFEDKCFDVVIALEVLEHVSCATEIKRVLKENGVFICSTPTPKTDFIRHILVFLHILENQDFEGHTNLIDLREIPMKLLFYKKMFFKTSQFGIFTKV